MILFYFDMTILRTGLIMSASIGLTIFEKGQRFWQIWFGNPGKVGKFYYPKLLVTLKSFNLFQQ